MVGTEKTRLVVVRGNSASRKSSVAAGLRERFGRGLALVARTTSAASCSGSATDPVPRTST
jgi:hypothetical protein